MASEITRKIWCLAEAWDMVPISGNELRLEQCLGRCLLNHGWNELLQKTVRFFIIIESYPLFKGFTSIYMSYKVCSVSLSICHWRVISIAFQPFLMFTTAFSGSLTCRLLYSNISANSVFLVLHEVMWKLICRQSISLLIE